MVMPLRFPLSLPRGIKVKRGIMRLFSQQPSSRLALLFNLYEFVYILSGAKVCVLSFH